MLGDSTPRSFRNIEIPLGLPPVVRMYGLGPYRGRHLSICLTGAVEAMHLRVPENSILVDAMFPHTNLRSIKRQLQSPKKILELSL